MLAAFRHRICLLILLCVWTATASAQINANNVMIMGRSALYYEDYVLSIQRFNLVISAKPNWAEPYFYRGLAKFYLEDYVGADADVSTAIMLNPYAENYYVLRGLCRIHLSRYDKASQDYFKAIDINPVSPDYWHNLVLCELQQDSFARADSCLDIMIRRWPKTSENYTLKAQAQMGVKDTIQAEQWLDRALEVNEYEGSALSMKAMLLLQRSNYAEGEKMLDRAIVQKPRESDLYVNRALARYNQENLRGAMDDYDAALELKPGSYVGHFNRGLLRAQVGDDNRAIEDFNFVIEREPDNYIAIYNRAILLNNTGDYRGAMRDLTTLLTEYPQFWDGYIMRAQIRRKVGDVYGAERDEFKVMKARIEGVSKRKTKKTRKQDDKDLSKYDQLVENESQEPVQEYTSEYRGRVQDHQADMRPMSEFVLTYYTRAMAISSYMPYWPQVEKLNATHALANEVSLTNAESSVSEDRINSLFEDISQVSESIENIERNTDEQSVSAQLISLLVRRAVDFYHVRDFESGIADLDRIISADPKHQIALYLRAQLRTALTLSNHSELVQTSNTPLSPSTEIRFVFNQVIDDLKAIVQQDDKQLFAFYNMGNAYMMLHDYDMAIESYSKVLTIDSKMPDAYYNRGIARILSGDKDKGLSDLSQAGELGLYSAYNLIKKYSKK